MTTKTALNLKIVTCSPEYWEFVRELRTNPKTIQGFFDQKPISKQEQLAYMEVHWPEHCIVLLDGKPVGYGGVIGGDIRICIDPNHQRKGIGRFLLQALMAANPRAAAQIKMTNHASRKLFESCGFSPLEPKDPRFVSYRTWIRVL